MDSLFIEFNDISDFNDVGGKAYNLGKLVAAGFNVPQGYVITTHAYHQFIQNNNLKDIINKSLQNIDISSIDTLEKISSEIRGKFESSHLNADLVDLIQNYHSKKSKTSFAVRSSATAEDLPDLSFAGQHDTFLNVQGLENISNAVVQCFSSLWTARAIQYREKNGINHLDVGNAVVVQEMIQSEISGVSFSANPVTGNRDEVVIEAIFGLGEALVSGMVNPDTYIVSENNHIDVKLGDQSETIVSKEEGGTITISQVKGIEQVLSDSKIIEIRNVTNKIAEFYGYPQDVEWAINNDELFILQSRNITTLFPIPVKSHDDLRLFISLNAVQGVMAPFTPMGQNILEYFIFGIGNSFNFISKFEDFTAIQSASERLWIDITSGLKHPIGRNLITKFMGIAEPESQKIIIEQLQKGRFQVPHGPPRIINIQRGIRAILYLAGFVRRIINTPDRARNKAITKSIRFVNLLEKNRMNLRNLEEQIKFVKETSYVIPRFIFLDLAPFITTGLGTFALVSRIGDAESLGIDYLDLGRSYPYNVTTQMNLTLWELSRELYGDNESKMIFQTKTTSEMSILYKSRELPEVTLDVIDQFLKEFGFRGFSEIDVGVPRWKEDPEPIISHLKTYLEITDKNHFPDQLFIKGRKLSESKYQLMFNNLQKTKFAKIKLLIFNKLIGVNRKTMGMREYPKFIWVRSLNIIRKVLLDIGEEFASMGKLEDSRDIFYLKIDEISNTIDIKEIIRMRKEAFKKEYSRENVPRIILSNGEVYYNSKPKIELKEGMMLGSAVSPGIVEGKARVVLKPNEGTLQPGEVLVCPATDPSWTPLFNIASALVMEVGGMMTHGSVVAREHGIPGVVSVSNCTTKIKTGQMISVNGSTGLVQILKG